MAARRTAHPALAAVLAALAAVACAPADEDGGSAGESGDAGACAPGALPTRTEGRFTVGTDSPAYPPWFVDDDPTTGQGYESAVAYAVAEELGYPRDQVDWTVVRFNTAVAPGPKEFDVDVNQVSISDERRTAVDFSSGYYDVRQAVIALETSPIAGATTVEELRGARLGAQVGTTSLELLTDVIAPSQQPSVFQSNDLAKAALANGQVDGIVVDLPTAFYITGAEVEGSTVVGQFEATGTGAAVEQFGMVLDRGSALTACVTAAVDALREDGTLADLEQQWLAEAVDAPVLR